MGGQLALTPGRLEDPSSLTDPTFSPRAFPRGLFLVCPRSRSSPSGAAGGVVEPSKETAGMVRDSFYPSGESLVIAEI